MRPSDTLYYQQKDIGGCVMFEDHAGEAIILNLDFICDPENIDAMKELSITVQDVRSGEVLQNPPEPQKQWGTGICIHSHLRISSFKLQLTRKIRLT